MNADDVARARYSIKLRDGREIQLVATYAGLLEGHPTEALNAELIEQDIGGAPNRMDVSRRVALVKPVLRSWRRGDPSVRPALPPVMTYAVFESEPTVRNEGCASSALLLWYQASWGLPPAAIVDEVAGIDWDEFAVDFDY